MVVSSDRLIKSMIRKGYKISDDDSKPFNINIIGVRSSDSTPDRFNDTISVLWKWNGNWNIFTAPATTDSGLFYLNNPINSEGTFILAEGQHMGMWKVGLHKGYEALQQNRPVSGYRDRNKDSKVDASGPIVTGMFGINGHMAAAIKSERVGKYSAGCQVWQYEDDFKTVIHLAKMGAKNWGNSFTYTLLHECDIAN